MNMSMEAEGSGEGTAHREDLSVRSSELQSVD
jgi:hypothetical protein